MKIDIEIKEPKSVQEPSGGFAHEWLVNLTTFDGEITMSAKKEFSTALDAQEFVGKAVWRMIRGSPAQ